MQTLRELFEYELQSIYYAERTLVETLDQLAQESSDTQIKATFEQHLQETRGHVERLTNVFSSLGKAPSAQVCPGIEGLIKEKKMFNDRHPTPQLLDLYNLGAGAKSERYEITSYEGLIALANGLGMPYVVALLQANLDEELQALERLQELSRRFQMTDNRAM